MAYGRRRYKKRTGNKKYFRKNIPTRTITKIVKRQINKNLETKYHVTEVSGAVTGTSANIFLLPSPGTGTTDQTRESDQIYLRSLYYEYDFIFEDSTNLVRFIIFQWMQDSSLNAPVSASILEAAVTSTVRAPYSMNNSQNFRILYDRTHTLADNGSNALIMRKGYLKKIPLRKIVYTNTNANAANIKKGQLYGLIVSDSALSGPSFSAAFKLNYTDA